MRISDGSSDVCSSDLDRGPARPRRAALVSEDRLSLYHRLSHALAGLCRGTNARVAVAGLALHPLVPSAGTTHHGRNPLTAEGARRSGAGTDENGRAHV